MLYILNLVGAFVIDFIYNTYTRAIINGYKFHEFFKIWGKKDIVIAYIL